MIITLSAAKEYLKITDTERDAFITTLINAVGAEIEAICRQPIEQREVVITLPSDDDRVGVGNIYLTQFPVTNVTLKGGEVVSEMGIVTADLVKTDFYRLFFDGAFKFYEVTCDVGYTEIPVVIQDICKEMVAIKYRDSYVGERKVGISSEAINNGGITDTTSYKDMRKNWVTRLGGFTSTY